MPQSELQRLEHQKELATALLMSICERIEEVKQTSPKPLKYTGISKHAKKCAERRKLICQTTIND